MIYFKNEKLEGYDQKIIEKSIRRFSTRIHVNLDIKSTSVLIEDEERYFLGLENKKYLKVTRLRTPLEKYFPKLIVRFPKSNFAFYKVRFSFFTFILIIISVFGLISKTYTAITNQIVSWGFILYVFFVVVFIYLTILELRFTKKRIIKAITKTI